MSGSAILMMCIACVGLWGGGLVSLVVMLRSSGKTAKEIVEDIEEAEPETFVE